MSTPTYYIILAATVISFKKIPQSPQSTPKFKLASQKDYIPLPLGPLIIFQGRIGLSKLRGRIFILICFPFDSGERIADNREFHPAKENGIPSRKLTYPTVGNENDLWTSLAGVIIFPVQTLQYWDPLYRGEIPQNLLYICRVFDQSKIGPI